MAADRFVVFIDGPSGPALLMQDDGHRALVFATSDAAVDAMTGHVLEHAFLWWVMKLSDDPVDRPRAVWP